MKRKMITPFFLMAALSIFMFSAQSSQDDPDGEAGATGSPGEDTCAEADCHDSYAVNFGIGSVEITSSDLINWEYVPGATYTISVTVEHAGKDLFGLGFEALKSNGDNAGTLIAGTDTHIKNKFVNGFSRKNIVHDDGTGASADTHTFNFTWQAPATNVGQVTFYVAGNASNDDGDESGDYIYTASQTVDAAVGVYELTDTNNSLEVFPNPFVNEINVIQHLNEGGNVAFKLFDQRGALVLNLGKINHGPGELKQIFDIASIPAGNYMFQSSLEGKIISSRIITKK